MNSLICRMLLLPMILLLLSPMNLSAAETILEKTVFTSGKITMILAAKPLKTMTEIPFTINIIGDSGSEISNAELSLNMDMPAMPMPPNMPEASWIDGAYRGVAIFTMAGAWQITVDIQRSDSASEQVIFAIDQVMMK